MHVRLFGMFAEALGTDTVLVRPAGTVAELRTALAELHPVFKNTPYRIAIDHRLEQDDAELQEHQEVAALPPFSGG